LKGLTLYTILLLCAAGCSGGSEDNTASDSRLTRHERDSVLAESRLPGAQGVKTTLTVADSANARTERLNKLSE
jgi:hypothetical protein